MEFKLLDIIENETLSKNGIVTGKRHDFTSGKLVRTVSLHNGISFQDKDFDKWQLMEDKEKAKVMLCDKLNKDIVGRKLKPCEIEL